MTDISHECNLGTTYDVHLGKRVVDFLSVLIELSLLGVTAESLRTKKRSKIGDFAPTRPL